MNANPPNLSREIVAPLQKDAAKPFASTAVLVASQPDLKQLSFLVQKETITSGRFYNGKYYQVDLKNGGGFMLCGPMVGAPYAVMIMESLAARGVSRFIFFGWCGAIASQVKNGDIVLPDRAFIDEGTSLHYEGELKQASFADDDLVRQLEAGLKVHGLPYQKGPVWTTDAVFRETVEKVTHFKQKGALAVEMELSALFTAARFRNIKAAGILAVSDTLSDFTWRPGFKEARFKENRQRICEVIDSICRQN